MKHEWKKNEKQFYLPKDRAETIIVPKFNFLTIEGKGNPNHAFFEEYIRVLYSLSYGIKMNLVKGVKPAGYFDYTVYPLEGVWSLEEGTSQSFNGVLNKDNLAFKLMIRQPDFVNEEFAMRILEKVNVKKPHVLLNRVRFEEISEGECIQMLHIGSYDDEIESFRLMQDYAEQQNLTRKNKTHREIYLNDFRKVTPEKLKTVLRIEVEKVGS